MARLFQSGFELNSVTAGVEFSNVNGSQFTIQTGTVRTGTYAGKISGNLGATFQTVGHQFAAANDSTDHYARFYLNIAAYPDINNFIAQLCDTSTNGTNGYGLRLTTAGKLQLISTNGGQVGVDSAVLNLNQWYRIELRFFDTNTTVDARIDGVSFASTTSAGNSGGVQYFTIGANVQNENATSGTWYFDDLALNDATGANQNSWPGAGQIMHLKPNAAGDNNTFTVQVGGTVGASNNYTRVNEVPPDDATSYNGDVTAGNIDDFNIDDTPAGIGASDTINVVAIGVRFRALVAAAEAAFKVRIKKTSGGTVSSSAAITPNSTTWKTNANAAPLIFPLITYKDPDGAAWTKATLDTAQIGYTISTTNTNAADISNVYLSVDWTPSGGGGGGPTGTFIGNLPMTGVG